MPVDPKYGKVSLEKRPDVPDDEPVFVLRAQDVLASSIVEDYSRDYFEATGDAAGRDRIINQAMAMNSWHPRKIPD